MEDDYAKQFTAMFEAHADELFRHCFLRLSDRERALDITQETFLRAWRYATGGGTIRSARPFLYRILNNLIVDEYRKHSPQSLDAILENENRLAEAESELLRDPSNALEDAIIRFDGARVLKALGGLPEPYRAVLLLRYVEGLSIGEISHIAGESENAISVRIHRALKKLKNILE